MDFMVFHPVVDVCKNEPEVWSEYGDFMEPRARILPYFPPRRLIAPVNPSVTTKLFVAILAATLLVAAAMGAAARFAFTRGFLGYLNEQGVQRVEDLLPGLSAAYAKHGNWDFLRGNPREWFRLMRAAPREGEAPGARREPDLTGTGLRVALLDAQKQFVVGNRRVGPDAITRPVMVGGRAVGWVAVVPFEKVSEAADVQFQEQQLTAHWIIGAFAAMLAAAVAFVLARLVLAPVKRLAAATHRLAAGDYGTRVTAHSEDELGRLAGDFNRLAHTLEKNEQMRRAMMADISHELRTPLAVLRGELEALEDGVRPLTPESVKSLQAEIALLSQTVSDLYDLSLSDTGALTYRKVDVDVCDVLHAALAQARPRFAARRIQIESTPADAAVIVSADEGRIRQLFNNLIENALRYTDPGGMLRVRCASAGARASITFEDSAPGVPEAELPRLFERFYRVDGSRDRASGGAGLGLAICRSIVEAHGGTITARASALGGLCIAISLPLAGTE
jgi:two-component system sensor histidine kinase BaeS